MRKKFFIILILPILALVGAWLLRGVFATSNPHAWTNGLVGYWSFDGQYTTTTSGTGAGTRDVSNNNNWGTFNGGVKPTPGVVGQALSFDGVDDFVNAGSGTSLNITGAITIEAWVRPTSAMSQTIINKYNGTNGYALNIGSPSYQATIQIANAGTVPRRWSNTAISTTQWTFITAVFNPNTNLDIYINGVLDNGTLTGSIPASVGSSSGINLQLGAYTTPSNFFNGTIDEVRIYNRALSADEVKQHYDQTRRNLVINNPSGTPPVGWWKMDEATGAQVRDYSVNANNGTVSNGGYGATSTDGKIGKALSFDGVDDYVNAGNGASLNVVNQLTITMWINPDTLGWRLPLYKGNFWDASSWGVRAFDNSYGFQFVSQTAGGVMYDSKQAAVLVDTGVWQYFVVTFDSGTVKVYKNGILGDTDTTFPATLPDTSAIPLKIGSDGAPYAYDGLIDDVRIYNYARTADQIAADFRAGAYRTIVGTSVPSTWWTDGLVGYWSFDGQYTTSTDGTRDVSNNGNWGAFNGGVKPVGGIVGQALSFDGVDDYVLAGSPGIKATDSFTIEFWFNASRLSTWNNSFSLVNYQNYGFYPYRSATQGIWFYHRLSDNNYVILISNTPVSLNTWYHAVVTYDSITKEYKIYQNAVNVGSVTQAGTDAYMDSSQVKIGHAASGEYFKGLIDDVRIYNRALGADEVMQHYQQTRRNLGI